MMHLVGRPRRASRTAAVAVAMLALVGLAASCGTPAPGVTRTWVEFSPTAADPATDFGPDARSILGTPTVTPKNRLVVLFAGSGGGPKSMGNLATVLQQNGFHVLGVQYDSDLPTLDACPDNEQSTNPDCHRAFRSEVVFGEGVPDPSGTPYDHPGVSVPLANSAMNGVLHQLDYAISQYPGEGFEQFQQQTGGSCDVVNPTYGACELHWDQVSLMGFSQGGGVALYLSKFVDVARVGMLSAAFDAYAPVGAPTAAPWVAEGGFATPVADIAHLSHVGDYNIFRQRAVADALGLPGAEVNIRLEAAPYGGTNRLVSDYIPACTPNDSLNKHNSTGGNSCSDVNAYRPAWLYLAEGPTSP